MRRVFVLFGPLLLLIACSSPPQKEIDLAQGAMDAARAAGAEQYAPEAFAAASTALQQAHDAVAQRDYRLALTRALDAHERAQEAAKGAADGKARARSEAEIAVVAATTTVKQFQGRVKEAETARIPRADLAAAQKGARDAADILQKARERIIAEDYLGAKATVQDLTKQVQTQTEALEAAAAKRPARSARRVR